MLNHLKEISFKKRLQRRHIIEHIFKMFGVASILFAICMLFVLLYSISIKGYSAFYTHYAHIASTEKANSEILQDDESLLIFLRNALKKSLKEANLNSGVVTNHSVNELFNLEYIPLETRELLIKGDANIKLLLSSNADMYLKGYLKKGSILDDASLSLIDELKQAKIITTNFNSVFFERADSRNPEYAGVKGAFLGSFYTIILTILLSVIVGIGAAVYLEEFAKKNRFFNILEVNINNLAAVPSIIFGLLGLIVFQQFFGVPRSTPMLASFVLTLMALPTIIITSRIALSTVPSTIKEAAYGLGSSKIQVITKHLIPISIPGMLTGIIIAISRVIGETAPLLMIGMVAFINSVPESFSDNAVVFPIQILLWSDIPELGYIEKASAAIMLLLLFLIFVNGISIYLRNKFEIKF